MLRVQTTCNEVDFLQELSQQLKDKSGSFVFYKFIGHSHPLFKDRKKFAKLNKNYRNAYQIRSCHPRFQNYPK